MQHTSICYLSCWYFMYKDHLPCGPWVRAGLRLQTVTSSVFYVTVLKFQTSGQQTIKNCDLKGHSHESGDKKEWICDETINIRLALSEASAIVMYHGFIISNDISAFVCVPWNSVLQDVISGIVCDSAPPQVKYGVRSPKFNWAPV